MTDYGNAEMLGLLREAVNIAAHGEAWHHKHMLWAQANGLQGHKRLHRYESAHDRAQYIKIQNYAVDMFGAIIVPDWDYAVDAPEDIKRAFHPPMSVEELVTRQIEVDDLHRAIAQLPEKQRRRLVLYYFDGCTYEQIAEMEGCKYQTVQDSIYTALKNLKKTLM